MMRIFPIITLVLSILIGCMDENNSNKEIFNEKKPKPFVEVATVSGNTPVYQGPGKDYKTSIVPLNTDQKVYVIKDSAGWTYIRTNKYRKAKGWVPTRKLIVDEIATAKELSDYTIEPEIAYYMTQEYVKGRLKAPATAEFPSARDTYYKYMGDSTYTIKAFVDSENSFGAMIRTQYKAQIKQVDDEKWQLLNLIIDD